MAPCDALYNFVFRTWLRFSDSLFYSTPFHTSIHSPLLHYFSKDTLSVEGNQSLREKTKQFFYINYHVFWHLLPCFFTPPSYPFSSQLYYFKKDRAMDVCSRYVELQVYQFGVLGGIGGQSILEGLKVSGRMRKSYDGRSAEGFTCMKI